MSRRGRSDAQLLRYLDIVQLAYLTARDGALDAVEDWMDVLSGGEKQRIAVSATTLPVWMQLFNYNSYANKQLKLFNITK